MKHLVTISFAVAVLIAGFSSVATAFELTYEGYVTGLDDVPVEGGVVLEFGLYDSSAGGEAIWTEGHNVQATGGHFAVRLGRGNALPEDPPGELWLQVTIQDDVIEPRTPVTAAMYAQRAAVADDVPGRDITPRTVSIQGVGEVIDADGNWVGGLAGTDADNDGFADVVEILLGTDPDDRNDGPVDENEDGIPDQLQGTPGQGADADEVAERLANDTQFRGEVATALFEGYGDELRGDDADPAEIALALSLDDTFRDLLALTLVSEYADQLRGPEGPPGEGGALVSPVVLGHIVPGEVFESLDTPAVIPDNNEFGFNSTLTIPESLSVERLTVSVEASHPDAGELRLTLFSPAGTSVVLYDGANEGEEDLNINIGRDELPAEGRMDDFYGEDVQGTWRLQAIDTAPGNAGRLVAWSLNVNESWDDGELFVGERISTAGLLTTEGGLEITLGGNLTMRNRDGEVVFSVDGQTGVVTSAGSAIQVAYRQVSTMNIVGCALAANGRVECWGGSGAHVEPPDETFLQLDVGVSHACGVRSDGVALCWGSNGNNRATPPEGTYRSVAAGNNHSCGIKSDGTAVCWGYDNRGQARAPGGQFLDLDVGAEHSCGILQGGAVQCWGYNNQGQTTAPGGTFRQISAGWYHNCAVRMDGTVACWGKNDYGERNAPVGQFESVEVGYHHSCGVRSDGQTVCWGRNSYGERNAPSVGFRDIAAGTDHSCGLRDFGKIICWGRPDTGRTTPP